MSAWKKILVGAVVGASVVLVPLRAEATAPGPIGPIVYVDNGGRIAVVDATGANQVSSTQTGSSPSWGPASQAIAYVSGGSIFTMTWNGTSFGAPAAVPNVNDAQSVAWSPSGTRFAYSNGGNVFRIGVDGTDKTNLTQSGGGGVDNIQPAWSPDGSEIAFATNRDTSGGTHDIYVMSATDGSNQTKLTASGADDLEPSWSPDGELIVFSSNRDGVAQIYRVPATGGTEVRLTNTTTAETAPSWSPTGAQIAIVHGGSLATAAGSGGEVTSLSPAPVGTAPDWGLSFGALAPPTVSPSSGLVLGTVLTASDGSWSAPPQTLAFQWQRCNSAGGTCVDISGATSRTYTLVDADQGSTLRVTVTASSSSGTASSTSAATATFQPTLNVVGQAPTAVTSPAVTVRPPFGSDPPADAILVGSSLFASVGTWSGQFPISFKYQWKKCDVTGACFTIAGATSSIFTATVAFEGWRIAVGITATNVLGSTERTSVPVGPVRSIAPTGSVTPTVNGQNVVGQTLSVTGGTWRGTTPFSFAYEWRRCDPQGTLESCVAIPGATGTTYTLTPDDLGVALRVWVTATNAAGSATLTTNHTFPTLPKPKYAPSAAQPPAVIGSALLGLRVSADRGSWSGDAPIALKLQWQRCDATGSGCRAVRGATKLTYLVTKADAGRRLRVTVTATNANGTLRASSPATEPIQLVPRRPGRRIVGTMQADYRAGGGFDDTILGRGGNDTLLGGSGNDLIDGGGGADILIGGGGRDRLLGAAGSDTILAGDGDRDVVDCGAGNDRAVVDSLDVVRNCEMIQFATERSPTTPTTTTTGSTTTSPTTTGDEDDPGDDE